MRYYACPSPLRPFIGCGIKVVPYSYVENGSGQLASVSYCVPLCTLFAARRYVCLYGEFEVLRRPWSI